MNVKIITQYDITCGECGCDLPKGSWCYLDEVEGAKCEECNEEECNERDMFGETYD